MKQEFLNSFFSALGTFILLILGWLVGIQPKEENKADYEVKLLDHKGNIEIYSNLADTVYYTDIDSLEDFIYFENN